VEIIAGAWSAAGAAMLLWFLFGRAESIVTTGRA
jgi:hypothetical protein